MEVIARIVKGFQLLSIFEKSSVLDLWQDSEYASEASNNWRKKLHLRRFAGFCIRLSSHYLFSQKLLAICLLNLINIFHHISSNNVQYCAPSNPQSYVQHISLMMKIIIVFPINALNIIVSLQFFKYCQLLFGQVSFKGTLMQI